MQGGGCSTAQTDQLSHVGIGSVWYLCPVGFASKPYMKPTLPYPTLWNPVWMGV